MWYAQAVQLDPPPQPGMIDAASFLLAALALFLSLVGLFWLHKLTIRFKRKLIRTEELALRAWREGAWMRSTLYASIALDHLQKTSKQPRFEPEFRAQFGEDVFLWELFDRSTQGYFIEVGAYDGITLSVTYALEAVGWSGLLIEPIPQQYARCRQIRPASDVVHAALSRRGSSGTVDFAVVGAEGKDQWLSHLARSTGHDALVKGTGASTQLVQVPLTTMDAVLEHTPPPVSGIDAVVIDIEDGEADLLDGFDLDRWKPKVLMIEDNHADPQNPAARLMQAAGYQEAGRLGINRVWIRPDLADLLVKARRLLPTK